MTIQGSRVLWHLLIIGVIIKNTPTLDPLSILLNSKVLIMKEGAEIRAFLTLKKIGKTLELGTVYTMPAWRSKGFSKQLIEYAIQTHQHHVHKGLLCKPKLVLFYQKLGFEVSNSCGFIIDIRRQLFNLFLSPLTRYKIVSMKYTGELINSDR